MKLLGRNVSVGELNALLKDASLEELLERVGEIHAVCFDTVRVGDNLLECIQIADMEDYLDRIVANLEGQKGVEALPLWAKIWPACLPLAMYMQRQPLREGDSVLEIGAGLGVAGLFAGLRGFPTVISDVVPDALVFARINVLHNQLGNAVQVRHVDFTASDMHGAFTHIIGSEVLYREAVYDPLLRFLRNHLRPSGAEQSVNSAEVLLTADTGRRALKFFSAAKEHFHLARSLFACRRDEAEGDHAGLLGARRNQDISLYRMRPK